MEKADFKKKLKHLYNPSSKEVSVVDEPPMNFLMVDGEGDPNGSKPYKDAVEALYAVSYALKFMVKKERRIDYGVMPLEGLWWVEDMSRFSVEDREDWRWTMMISQPEHVTEALFEEAGARVESKKNPPALPKLRFEAFHEGRAAQILHLGPYSEEGPNVERVHQAIEADGHKRAGRHHEVYLTDPNRTAPERLKTIIRQPFS